MTPRRGDVALPEALRAAIADARCALDGDQAGHVAPQLRKTIYAEVARCGGSAAAAWLSVIAAERVVGIWQRTQSDERVVTLLHQAQAALSGTSTVSPAPLAETLWSEHERVHIDVAAYPAYHAATAVIAAARHAAGTTPFRDLADTDLADTDLADTDLADEDYLDAWTADAAHWARRAAEGALAAPAAVIAWRRSFWRWWLDEALSEACQRARLGEIHPLC